MLEIIAWLKFALAILLVIVIFRLLTRVEALEKRAGQFERDLAVTGVSIQSLIACKQDKEM